jgi:predicted RNase H-like HicB family nuclease
MAALVARIPQRETMTVRYLLSDYMTRAMALAIYDKLDEGSYTGRIQPCKGVVAFGPTLQACEATLRSTLEEWIVLGLKLGHPLPVIDNIDLNITATRESVDAL